MQIRKDGEIIYNSIDNTGSTDDAAMGARTTKGRLDTLDGRFAGYYTKAEVLELLTGIASTYIVSELPASPDANTYYMVGNDADGYVLHYYDHDLEHALVGSYELDLSAVSPQKTELPTASADYSGKVYQYIGNTQASYGYGMWYTCVNRQFYAWLSTTGSNMYTYTDSPAVGDTIYSEAGIRYAYKVKSISGSTMTDTNDKTWTRNTAADMSRWQWEAMYQMDSFSQVTDNTMFRSFDLYNRMVWSCRMSLVKQYVLDAVYPVGSIYITMGLTNPATLFGGTWEKLPGDRYLLNCGSTYNVVNSTGGAKEVTLKRSDLPKVSVTTSSAGAKTTDLDGVKAFTYKSGGQANKWGLDYGTKELYESKSYGASEETASAHTHSFNLNGNVTQTKVATMPPYVTVVMWKRTA